MNEWFTSEKEYIIAILFNLLNMHPMINLRCSAFNYRNKLCLFYRIQVECRAISFTYSFFSLFFIDDLSVVVAFFLLLFRPLILSCWLVVQWRDIPIDLQSLIALCAHTLYSILFLVMYCLSSGWIPLIFESLVNLCRFHRVFFLKSRTFSKVGLSSQ